MVKNAVICAAGLGSRLGFDIPKCLVDIGNEKLIYYLLKALDRIENIRIVVGFKEKEVINYVKQIRKDVLFIRNPEFASTTNSYSLHLGTKDLQEPFLTVDGDMIVDHDSINVFINSCKIGENKVGITESKTDDAVFVKLNDRDQVIGFSREENTGWEWSGIAYLQNELIKKDGRYVFEDLIDHLPLNSAKIKCFEIDTPDDLMYMRNNINDIVIST